MKRKRKTKINKYVDGALQETYGEKSQNKDLKLLNLTKL